MRNEKLKAYEKGNMEDDYSGHCEYSDGGSDRDGNNQLHGNAGVRSEK